MWTKGILRSFGSEQKLSSEPKSDCPIERILRNNNISIINDREASDFNVKLSNVSFDRERIIKSHSVEDLTCADDHHRNLKKETPRDPKKRWSSSNCYGSHLNFKWCAKIKRDVLRNIRNKVYPLPLTKWVYLTLISCVNHIVFSNIYVNGIKFFV